MNGPTRFVEHLQSNQYHPRSDAHSNAMCMAILGDLLEHCAPLAGRARAGRLVAELNHTVTVNHQRWNIDLALGPPADGARSMEVDPIRFATPSLVEVAVEVKGIMTEHGKARYNRLRDLQAFHHHAHVYNEDVVAVGVVVVNVAPVFWSPTRDRADVTSHGDIRRIGRETVDTFRNLPLRHSPRDGAGLEAATVLLVDHDNLRKNPDLPPNAPDPRETRLVSSAPAPASGDPLNYVTMVHRVCRAYGDRWISDSAE